jgi:protein-disulfide isomerase
MNRSIVSVLIVLGTAVAGVAVARGSRKPYSPEAPAYRQKGPADAPVVIVEFSDLQCPACRYAVEPLKNLYALYPGKIRVVYKHFPLDRVHPHARGAARLAECAGKEGKFWELHDQIYENQHEWYGSEKFPDDQFARYAKKAGLDYKKLSACAQDPAIDAVVTKDAADGDARWVSSTPTFFLNGKRLVGAKQLGGLGPIYIDRMLRK